MSRLLFRGGDPAGGQEEENSTKKNKKLANSSQVKPSGIDGIGVER